MFPRSLRLPFQILCLAALATSALAAGKGQSVTVMVSGQGTPVPDVKVTLAPDTGIAPESWNVANAPALATIPTDATGHALFADVPPGKYIVTTSCGLPGNWIAGNYASKLEVLPARPSTVTLTLRKGAMVRGKAMQGTHVAGHAEIRSDSPDALMSTCGMMTPSLVDSTLGTFTVSKIPLNATTWVKGELAQGDGSIGVWKDFHFDKPDTADMTLEFPEMGPKDVGSLVLTLVADSTAKPDSGIAQLLQVTPDGKWRYEANVTVGGLAGATHVDNLPAGAYQIRAYAVPGASEWWNAPIDSLTVLPGKTAKYVIKVKVRS